MDDTAGYSEMQDAQTRILLVDDIEANLIALKSVLDRPDLRLLTARSGAEALEILLKEEDVALAMLDVQMPEMSGFELAELMRGALRTRHVPIIFLTAHAHEPGRVFEGYEAGAVDFLFKPLDPVLLRSKVEVFVELHRQRRLSDIFIGVLGHDLRNPLGAIRIGADLLLHLYPNDERVRKTANTIRCSSDRMSRLIGTLLDYARARLGGGIPIQLAPANMADLCRATMAEFGPENQARLALDVQGDPAGTWDADRILQAISNLIGNALTHGEPEEPVSVRVDASAEAEVTLEVRNRGVIPEDARAHLFEALRRTEKRSSDSVGLGLYIVDQIVRSHGGRMEVESSAASGTMFRVRVPRHARAADPTPIEPAA